MKILRDVSAIFSDRWRHIAPRGGQTCSRQWGAQPSVHCGECPRRCVQAGHHLRAAPSWPCRCTSRRLRQHCHVRRRALAQSTPSTSHAAAGGHRDRGRERPEGSKAQAVVATSRPRRRARQRPCVASHGSLVIQQRRFFAILQRHISIFPRLRETMRGFSENAAHPRPSLWVSPA